MKKLLSLLLVLLLSVSLASCGELVYDYNEDNMSAKTEDGAVKWSCDIRYPFFKGGCSDEINAALDPVLRGFRDEAVAAQGDADEVYGKLAVGFQFDLDVDVIECIDGYISLRLTEYRYLGGVHGGRFIHGLIFDEKTGDAVTANELLGLGVSEFAGLVLTEVRSMMDAQPEYFFSDIADEQILGDVSEGLSCCYLEGNELVYVFQEYAIAPYVGGPQYVRIPIASVDNK